MLHSRITFIAYDQSQKIEASLSKRHWEQDNQPVSKGESLIAVKVFYDLSFPVVD
jgi:hypothetical protein